MGDLGGFAKSQPDKPAWIMAGSGAMITFGELETRSRAMSVLLADAGLGRGDTLAVVAENRLEWAEIVWAAARTGIDIAPINYHLGPDEVRAMLAACAARAVVFSQSCWTTVETALSGLDTRIITWVIGGYEEQLAAAASRSAPREVLGGRVMFSSGTTGTPKALRHPGPAVHPRDAPPHLGEYTQRFALGSETVYLSPAPMYHTAPFRFTFAMTQLGATVVCMERFDPGSALDAIGEYRVTHAQFVPTMLLRMAALPAERTSAVDVSSLTVAITGGAPCPPELKDRILSWWGPVLHELYGASEGYGNTHIGPAEAQQRRGSVGRPVRGSVYVTDAAGLALPAGAEGMVWFRGGSQAGDDEVRTVGDIGYVDDAGYLYLTGRGNQIIICGGVNIHPQAAEDVLIVHPAVCDVVVVGKRDAEYGEIPVAYVVPRVVGPDAEILADDLLAYCRDRLAHFKCPREITFVPALPRGDNGKMYKRLLERFDHAL
ncbi:AMP-binding protein [Mycolicibacterium neoaurum]|uniref:AMP-binding protein n=1 Tax=Mycolicibacterium neoaurum TaxID=1795 RepID=UPI002670FF2E|nr:AMP-binding protein [Mycolicibacterium neoaurum]MDO3402767.1 AMP-binding protein [Mycolicibacterium neoaurum]